MKKINNKTFKTAATELFLQPYQAYMEQFFKAEIIFKPQIKINKTQVSQHQSNNWESKFSIKLIFAFIFLLLFSSKSFSQITISYGGSQTYNINGMISPLSPTVSGGTPAINGQTLTIAGNYAAGYTNGSGVGSTSFNQPIGMVADGLGNIYISDAGNEVIRKISATGAVTTFAGTGTPGSTNGTGTAAAFFHPVGMCVDPSGNIYIADENNQMIRKMTPAGVVTTFAGSGTAGSANGTGTAASFNLPCGVASDLLGNIYVADYNNNQIRKITPAGVVSTFAGSGSVGSANGTGTAATFNHPFSVAVDAGGNIYVADRLNYMIRKVDQTGVVTTLAGNTTAGSANGTGTAASFNYPTTLTVDGMGNVYVADEMNNKIRAITPAGVVTTLAGQSTAGHTDGAGSVTTFSSPFAVSADQYGNIFVCDYAYNIIRKVVSTQYTISPQLSAGLSFNRTNGTISGTPTVAAASTIYTISAFSGTTVANSTLTITVNGMLVVSPTVNQNYVITNEPRIAGINNDSTLMASSGNSAKLNTSIQYVDGLGRPIQSIEVMASPMGNDIIQPEAYDQYGREITKYLPYTPSGGTFGAFRSNAVSTDQGAFYTTPPTGVTAIANPYSQTNFDNSPLSRTAEQGAPGVAWQLTTSGVTGSGHTIKMVYTLNNAIPFSTDSINSRQVAMYYTVINNDLSQTLYANGYYPANMLTVTIGKDENWTSGRAGTAEEYKDIDGHVVLKRVYNYTGAAIQMLSTYYVYDDIGRLAFVLPPLSGADGAGTISTTTLKNLCYQYQYDGLGRQVQKKIPGKGWEFTVYNNMDQPVAMQDTNQRANNQWIFKKYDALQRVVQTGIWNNGGTNGTSISRASLQGNLNAIVSNLYEAPQNTGNGYSTVAWPTTNQTATLNLNYYDGYSLIPGIPGTFITPVGANLATRGEVTATLTSVLNTPTNQLWNVIYYDFWGRGMETYAQHYFGGTVSINNFDAITNTYNFINMPTTVVRKHWNSASTTYPLVTDANTYIYDQAGRKLKSWEQISNGNYAPTLKTLLSQTVYNEIGQVVSKQLHSTDSLNYYQVIAYTYNERGWLITSGAPLFAMQLYYNTGTNKQYNGNIAYQYWGTPGNLNNNYTYTYDKLNRLTSGVSADNYKETGITYDVMGNITQLNRYQANTLIDQLTYTYTNAGNPTNQLQSINDATTSNFGLKSGTSNFTYDGNGNLITDPTKGTSGISIAYNLLNLPQNVTGSKTITYTYDANGNKLRRVSPVTNNTDYINGIEYDGTTTETLTFLQTEEGKAVLNGTGYDYQYYLGDNLGNTRNTFSTKTGVAVSTQQDDYYPFGLEISRNVLNPKNEYLYNKKELQEELSEYDYGARFYDPVIARWNTLDPLAEFSRMWSPYNYVLNSPIRLTDPDGMAPDDTHPGDPKWSSNWDTFGIAGTVYSAAPSGEEQCCKTPTQDHTSLRKGTLTKGTGKHKKLTKGEFEKLVKFFKYLDNFMKGRGYHRQPGGFIFVREGGTGPEPDGIGAKLDPKDRIDLTGAIEMLDALSGAEVPTNAKTSWKEMVDIGRQFVTSSDDVKDGFTKMYNNLIGNKDDTSTPGPTDQKVYVEEHYGDTLTEAQLNNDKFKYHYEQTHPGIPNKMGGSSHTFKPTVIHKKSK